MLPHKACLLARLLELIADQAVSSQVSDFHLARFSAAVFLYQAVVHVLEADGLLFSQTAEDKKNNQDFLAEDHGSLWFHSFTHSVEQLERTLLPLAVYYLHHIMSHASM